jgi:hypothetical protein
MLLRIDDEEGPGIIVSTVSGIGAFRHNHVERAAA